MAAADQTYQAGVQQGHWPSRQGAQLTSLSEAARRLLKGTQSAAAPMISRAGVRGEARRAHSILRAAMKDQELTEVNKTPPAVKRVISSV